MTFHLRLEASPELPTLSRPSRLDVRPRGPLSAHDELVSVLRDQCRALHRTGRVHFYVGGFGQATWPVDVSTDLAVVLEQLPGVMVGLREEGQVFQLNFFEQGIERYLTGVLRSANVTFECISLQPNWTPKPGIEVVAVTEAVEMFRELSETFRSAVSGVCPWLSEEPAFQLWTQCVERGTLP